eukprot:NODE_25_length_35605_cov_0.353461.p12 type:complete len:259 gc:universal NODE_25_length_35605_cov_0.353461:27190-27966(+)
MKPCAKCDSSTDIILNCTPFCKNCLLDRTKKNFIRTLSRALDTKGRYDKSRKKFKVMVAYNGSLSSKCCIHILHDYVCNRPQVESIVLCNIKCADWHSPYEIERLSTFPIVQKTIPKDPNNIPQGQNFIALLDNELLNSAIENDCNILLYCHDTEHLASQLLTKIVCGNAAGIESFEVFDKKIVNANEIKVVYPLQEITRQELVNYAEIMNIGFTICHNPGSDFLNITKNFLFSQQKIKASTCSIITKTLSKVKTHNK